jgi:ADP-ribose pyrophosphatase YjhB (NUDIX family)
VISPQARASTLKVCPLCGLELNVTEIGGRERLYCPSGGCEFVHWDNPKPVTATLVRMESGLVLVKRKFEPYIGDWCLPGGFIEAKEHPAESAAREVQEETGLLISSPRLVDAAAPGRGINVVILFYLAEAAGGELVAGDDASEVGVFDQDQLPTNVAFELHRNIIHRFFQGHF